MTTMKALVLAVALAACGSKAKPAAAPQDTPATTTDTAMEAPAAETPAAPAQ